MRVRRVTLSDDEAKRRGTQKSVIERMAPPTFDVAVEIVDRHCWRVHLDLAAAVDAALKGARLGTYAILLRALMVRLHDRRSTSGWGLRSAQKDVVQMEQHL